MSAERGKLESLAAITAPGIHILFIRSLLLLRRIFDLSRRYVIGAALAFFLGGAMITQAVYAAGWNITQLMHALAQVKSGQASFVETKYLGFLDKPIQSSGNMRFVSPDILEMHTVKPDDQVMLVQGDVLTVDKHTIQLDSHPELLAFVDSIRGVLAGNTGLLERYFTLSLKGEENSWSLMLVPKKNDFAKQIKHITVGGIGHMVRSIEIVKANHDWSLISISNSSTP
ncbi:MAG: LolA family protein [Acidithiobacillus sp.]